MTKPYLLYSDVHCHDWDAFSHVTADGLNNRLAGIVQALSGAYEHLRNEGGRTAFCAGDLFHERGKIRPSIMNPVAQFYQKHHKIVRSVIIPGNHDLETNETTWQGNALFTLPGVEAVNAPSIFNANIAGACYVCMIPWQPSVKALLAVMREATSMSPPERTDLIIHAPLDGVLRGVPEHGLTPEVLFNAYPAKRIFCGHYHNHIGFGDRVYSVGALTHQTWSDVGTKAGYLLVYPDRVEHFETTAPKFIDVDELLKDEKTDDESLEIIVKGNYTRVSVTDPTALEVGFIRDKLKSMGAAGTLVRAIATGADMSTARTAVAASMERLDESILNYAEKQGGEPLAQLCAGIFKSVETSWKS